MINIRNKKLFALSQTDNIFHDVPAHLTLRQIQSIAADRKMEDVENIDCKYMSYRRSLHIVASAVTDN